MRKTLVFEGETSPKPTDYKNFQSRIQTDWHGHSLQSSPSYLFWLDPNHLHFWVRVEGSSGAPHPDGKAGIYQAELWKYDVAEFFLASPDGSRYLEFNLSPTGAWWSCLFESKLTAEKGQPAPIPGVHAEGTRTDSFWEAHARVPRKWLEDRFPFDRDLTLNTTFILNTPDQIFVTAANLGPGEPDFHRPEAFPPVKLTPPA